MTAIGAVIIPTLNEQDHIGALLDQVRAAPRHRVGRILVVDGGSTDATRAIVAACTRLDERVALVDNPERLQSAGINIAVATLGRGITVFVRMDAHAVYPDDYAVRVLDRLASTNADVLATRLRTVGDARLPRAIAAASNSIAGTGGSAHRIGGYSGFVDHGHHAGFRRDAFDRVGGYDSSFVANEDAEFDVRIRRAGGRIWLAGDIEVGYAPRRSLGALARQYWRYGVGRASTFLKHRERLRLRQIIPFLFCIGLVAAALGTVVSTASLIYPLLYLAAVGAVTCVTIVRTRSPSMALVLPVLVTMHVAWGFGFMWGLIRARMASPSRDRRVGSAKAEDRL